MSNNNYNDINKLAQQYGLNHKRQQYLTPTGWGRGFAETTNLDYKDKMDILRTQDSLMRDIVMGKDGTASFKDLVSSANKAFEEDRYLDVTHWLYVLSGSIQKMIKEGEKVTDLSPEQLGQAYSNYSDADLDKDFFQNADDGFISNAGVMDFLGKMFGGNQIEKMYWKKIRERKIAVQKLLSSSSSFIQIINETLNIMGTARAQGSIASWLAGYQRIVNEYNKFYSSFKAIFETHLKELVDLAKKKRDDDEALFQQQKAKFNGPKNTSEVPNVAPVVDEPTTSVVPDTAVPEETAQKPSTPMSIEEVPDEIVVNDDGFHKQEIKSRPATKKELEESARRSKLVSDELEETRVNKLVSLIKKNPEKRDEYIEKYESGDFSFLEDEKYGVAVDKNIEIEPAIEKDVVKPFIEDVKPVVKDIVEPVAENIFEPKVEDVVEDSIQDEIIVEDSEGPMTEEEIVNEAPLEVAPESIPEITPEAKDEIKESPRDIAQEILKDVEPSGKTVTLVMLPKGGIDNMEEEKARLEKQLGTEIVFVTESSAEIVGNNYIKDDYDVDVKSYKELTNTKNDAKIAINFNDPSFIKTLPRLSNGKLWVARAMDDMFNHLGKKEQDEIRKKLIALRLKEEEAGIGSEAVVSQQATSIPEEASVAPSLNDSQVVENHVRALETLYDQPMDQIKEKSFDLLNDKKYVQLLPTNKDGTFNLNLISKFPEVISGGKFFLNTLKGDNNKKEFIEAIDRMSKKSSLSVEMLKIANERFYKELENSSSKKEAILKLCEHSELIDKIDPAFSVKLLQQAVKINND